MSGQKIVLTGVNFSDPNLPVLRDDSLLSSGSLFLFDPSHSLGGFSGVPENAASVPNVAWQEAAGVLGAGSQSSLAASVLSDTEAGVFQVERSSRGGVHGMSTQGTGQTAARFWQLLLPSAVRDHIYNNRASHTFYFSVWRRVTRPAAAGLASAQSPFHYAAAASQTSNYLFHFQNGVGSPSGALFRDHTPTANDNAVAAGTNRFSCIAVDGVTGTGPASGEPVRLGVGAFGSWASLNYNKAPSAILYRAYVEDLTVSGRTPAEVAAKDRALWQAAFAEGGRYHGDTYSNPATALP